MALQSGPLSKDLLAIEIAHFVRRKTNETNQTLAVNIFADMYNIDADHVLRVINSEEDASEKLLDIVKWRKVTRITDEYWPLR